MCISSRPGKCFYAYFAKEKQHNHERFIKCKLYRLKKVKTTATTTELSTPHRVRITPEMVLLCCFESLLMSSRVLTLYSIDTHLDTSTTESF